MYNHQNFNRRCWVCRKVWFLSFSGLETKITPFWRIPLHDWVRRAVLATGAGNFLVYALWDTVRPHFLWRRLQVIRVLLVVIYIAVILSCRKGSRYVTFVDFPYVVVTDRVDFFTFLLNIKILPSITLRQLKTVQISNYWVKNILIKTCLILQCFWMRLCNKSQLM